MRDERSVAGEDHGPTCIGSSAAVDRSRLRVDRIASRRLHAPQEPSQFERRVEEHGMQMAEQTDDVVPRKETVVRAPADVAATASCEHVAFPPFPPGLGSRSKLAKLHGRRRRRVNELSASPPECEEEFRLEHTGEHHLRPVRIGLAVLAATDIARRTQDLSRG